MLWPQAFIPAAYSFAVLVYLSVIGRIIVSVKALEGDADE